VANKCVLDVACGTGYGTNLLSKVAANVNGIDISNDSISYAKKKYRSKKLQYSQGDVCQLPFEDASFDVITSFETIEHIDQYQQDLAMKEFQRLLKPEGILIISTPNLDSDLYKDVENEFHVKEFHFAEFKEFIGVYFSHSEIIGQSFLSASVILNHHSKFCETLAVVENNYVKPESFYAENAKFSIAICSKSELTEQLKSQLENSLLLDSQNSFYEEYDSYVISLRAHLEQKDLDINSSMKYAETLSQNQEVLNNEIFSVNKQNKKLAKLHSVLLEDNTYLQDIIDTKSKELVTSGLALEELQSVYEVKLIHEENLFAALSEKTAEIDEMQSGFASLQLAYDSKVQHEEKLSAALNDKIVEIDEMQSSFGALQLAYDSKAQHEETLSAALNDKAAEIDEMQNSFDALQLAYDSKVQHEEKLSAALNDKTAEIDEMDNTIQRISDKNSECIADIEFRDTELEKSKYELKVLRQSIQKEKQHIVLLQNSVDDHETTISELHNVVTLLKSQLEKIYGLPLFGKLARKKYSDF
jgi:ubiquinone/menaquinone biosynthesis C-methylase UbiE/allophanate hydrolase subunit 1